MRSRNHDMVAKTREDVIGFEGRVFEFHEVFGCWVRRCWRDGFGQPAGADSGADWCGKQSGGGS